jgi:hypothetical protein
MQGFHFFFDCGNLSFEDFIFKILLLTNKGKKL